MTLTNKIQTMNCFLMTIIILCVTGCAVKIDQNRAAGTEQKTEWLEDTKTHLMLGTPVIDSGDINVSVSQIYTENEYSYINNITESRTIRLPDPFFTVLAAFTLFMTCLPSDLHGSWCFGHYPDWYRVSPQRATQNVATGNVRTKSRSNTQSITPDMYWIGYREDASVIKKMTFSPFTVTRLISVTIKQMATLLPARPAMLDVVFSVPGAEPVRITVSKEQLAALSLESDNWLATDVLKDLLMSRITTALKNNDYKAALPSFQKLERIEPHPPESFDYYYIETLSGVGEKAAARQRMNDYLAKYGKKGKHYPEIIGLLSRP